MWDRPSVDGLVEELQRRLALAQSTRREVSDVVPAVCRPNQPFPPNYKRDSRSSEAHVGERRELFELPDLLAVHLVRVELCEVEVLCGCSIEARSLNEVQEWSASGRDS